MEQSVSIFGAGSWGTALAQTLARKGTNVTLWCHDPDQARAISLSGYNPKYLTDFELSSLIEATGLVQQAAQASDLWVLVTPTQAVRQLLHQLKPFWHQRVKICNAAKGIEIDSLKTISTIAREILPGCSFSVLSGPSHAEEVIRDLPTAVVAASDNMQDALLWQSVFNRDNFRVYTNDDMIGVEVGAAVKNVIAIASGYLHSLELGDNATAAMVCRGLAEILRLAAAMGGKPITLSGLAGIGDLIVTAYSRHSRNFRLGELLGQGLNLEQARTKLGQVAEGAYTVRALTRLSEKLNVELPICRAVYSAVYEGLDPKQAVKRLLNREPKPEYSVPSSL